MPALFLAKTFRVMNFISAGSIAGSIVGISGRAITVGLSIKKHMDLHAGLAPLTTWLLSYCWKGTWIQKSPCPQGIRRVSSHATTQGLWMCGHLE